MNKRNLVLLSGACLALIVGVVVLLPEKDEPQVDAPIGHHEQEHIENKMPEKERDPFNALLNKDAEMRISADFTSEVDRISPSEAEKVREMVLDKTDIRAARNAGMDLLRKSNDPFLEENLIQILEDPEESEGMKNYSVQQLFISAKKAGPHNREKWVSKIVSALAYESEDVKREAFLALTRLKHDIPKEIISEYIDSPKFEFMRDLMIRGAQKYDIKEVLPSVRNYIYAEKMAVRVAAINSLGEWNDIESREKLEIILASEELEEHLRNTVVKALKRLNKT